MLWKRERLSLLTALAVLLQVGATIFRYDGWPLTNYPMFATLAPNTPLEGFELWTESFDGQRHFFAKDFGKLMVELFRLGVEGGRTNLLRDYFENYRHAGKPIPDGTKTLWLVKLTVSPQDLEIEHPQREFVYAFPVARDL